MNISQLVLLRNLSLTPILKRRITKMLRLRSPRKYKYPVLSVPPEYFVKSGFTSLNSSLKGTDSTCPEATFQNE